MAKSVTFYSDNLELKGLVYYPDNLDETKVYPTVVLCHGFAGVKELLLPNFAKKFAEEGFIAFTFDYRGFGESEGNKGVIIPNEQVRDIRNAITFISSQKEVDSEKIALWGTSLGGANALVATALDNRVKNLTVQITFANGERNNTSGMNEDEKHKLKQTLYKAWTNGVTKNRVMKLPLKRVLSDEQSKKFFDSHIEEFPEALSETVPFTTTLLINEYKPEEYFDKIQVPVLVVGASNDIVNLPSESKEIYEKLGNVEKDLIMVDADHYDIYYGENLNTVAGKQIEWLKKM